MSNIETLRQQINEIDHEIIKKLSERFEIGKKIGLIKSFPIVNFPFFSIYHPNYFVLLNESRLRFWGFRLLFQFAQETPRAYFRQK